MPAILTVFANQTGDGFLPNLQAEDDAVFQALGERMLANHFLVFRDSYATRNKLIYFLRLLRQELFLFHYSGHASQEVLDLPEENVLGEGVAEMLRKCTSLEVVVLNGCCTVKQARRLHELGIPVVVGTATKIEDETAKIFSEVFYQSLTQEEGYPFKKAFDDALAATKTINADVKMFRGDEEEDDSNDLCWDLHIDPKYSDQGLPKEDPHEAVEGNNFKPNRLLVRRLFANSAITSVELERYREMLVNKTGTVSPSKRRNAIVNCFPAPVGEALRKLMCPPAEDEQGYDTISNKRLEQTIVAYNTTMELLTFTLVAQVFEIMLSYRNIRKTSKFPIELAQQLNQLIKLKNEERSLYPYIYLIRELRKWLEDEEEIEETIIESTETSQDEEIVEVEEVEVVEEEEEIADVPFAVIENVPIFPGCESKKNNAERKACMSEKVSKLVNKKFNTELGADLGLSGVNRIFVSFKIDRNGNIVNIRSRAPHPRLEEEAKRVIKLLPKMTPGKQRGKPVGVLYSLPITFKVED